MLFLKKIKQNDTGEKQVYNTDIRAGREKSMPHFCDIYYCLKEKEEQPRQYVKRLLEYGFKNSFGIPYREEEIQTGKYGKPYMDKEGIHFNISHGHRIVTLACADVPVGIDVESARTVRENAIKKSCTPKELEWLQRSENRELDFLKLWTLKESYVKMVGEGLRIPLPEVEFFIEETEEITSNRTEGDFFQYELTEGILSLCLKNKGHTWKKEELNIYRLSGDLELKMTDDKKV